MRQQLKFYIIIGLLLSSVPAALVADNSLSVDRQIEIIEHYMYVTGQMAPSQAAALEEEYGLSDELPLKCGTPAILEFYNFRDKLDPLLLKAMGAPAIERPTYAPDSEYVYDSPGGHFKVHYAKTGGHAVYEASRDSDGDGVPDYVEATALILDSVRMHIIDALGYPAPPEDSFYASGGDEKYDVYFRDLSAPVFGQTSPDEELPGQVYPMHMTSFMELENDYSESIFQTYWGRPLDAVRVTCAHEYFHAVHFGIDATEQEVDDTPDGPRGRPYWYEMSAVWMEEEIYDEINDYYSYLDTFFVNPRVSIQRFNNMFDLHPYASSIFAIFLAEKFGRDIIHNIWDSCGQNPGPDFLAATELVLRATDTALGDSALPTAFRDFTLWNYFTGERHYDAPPGVGYSEMEYYPEIPDTVILKITRYPHLQLGNRNRRNPQHNSAAYLRLDHLYAMVTDSTRIDGIPTCIDGQDDPCTLFVPLSALSDDDSLSVSIGIGTGVDSVPPQRWGLNIIFRADSLRDSFIVEQFFLPYQTQSGQQLPLLQIVDPTQYRSAVLIVSPASYYYPAYRTPPFDYSFTHAVQEILDSARIGDTVIFIDSEFVDIPASILAPYPNPAVVSRMNGEPLRFKFQIPTDQYSNYIYEEPSFSVDIFTLAGEFVKSIDTAVAPSIREKQVEFALSWDMKNELGRQVASGVYIAVGRVFASDKHTELLAEDRVKVAIIR
ncbi:MAG: MXAN_6640 family putative metalloprotease [Candidatus Zixiibacteriota bacterium]